MSMKALPPWTRLGEQTDGGCIDGACAVPLSGVRDPLFETIPLGKISLANRFVMAPMGQERSPGGVPGKEMVDHYVSRVANGGVGLVISEATYIDHASAGEKPNLPRLAPGPAEAGFAAMACAVHDAGGAIFVQLFHQGADDAGRRNPALAFSPSGVSAIHGPFGKAMTLDDIRAVIAAYARSAALAKALGFDGVEIHGAHGYLVDQFLWKRTNRRTDVYGGMIANRARFAAEIVAAVREATGPDFPISFRISQWKVGVPGARLVFDAAELEALLDPIVRAGADILHASGRHHDTPAFAGSSLTLAGWIKKISGLPTITVGSVGVSPAGQLDPDPDLTALLGRLEGGEFDLVAVGRALLADPAWVSRLNARRRSGESMTPI